eukprot:9492287-Pyramimonas_sp.AAC.1
MSRRRGAREEFREHYRILQCVRVEPFQKDIREELMDESDFRHFDQLVRVEVYRGAVRSKKGSTAIGWRPLRVTSAIRRLRSELFADFLGGWGVHRHFSTPFSFLHGHYVSRSAMCPDRTLAIRSVGTRSD